jgi:hypothetical protein
MHSPSITAPFLRLSNQMLYDKYVITFQTGRDNRYELQKHQLRLRGCVMKRHEDSVFALRLICQEANVIR